MPNEAISFGYNFDIIILDTNYEDIYDKNFDIILFKFLNEKLTLLIKELIALLT